MISPTFDARRPQRFAGTLLKPSRSPARATIICSLVLLLAAACDTLERTGVDLTVRTDPELELDQLRVSTYLDDGTILGPRHERPEKQRKLSSVETLLLLFPDSLIGEGVTIHVEGLRNGQLVNDGEVRLIVQPERFITAEMSLVPPPGEPDYILTVSLLGEGHGAVVSDPEGIDCGEDCSASFEAKTEVTLTATPSPGSAFVGWIGACAGLETCIVYMTQARAVAAIFQTKVHRVTTSTGPRGTIRPGGQMVEHGETASFSVTPEAGYQIASVSGCGGSLSDSIYTTGPITEDCTLVASFEERTHLVETMAQEGGSISPEAARIEHGRLASFTISPDPGHRAVSATGCQGHLSGDAYTTGPIHAPCTIVVAFSAIPCGGIGNECDGGAVFAGTLNDRDYFVTSADEGAFTWNAGTTAWTRTGAGSSDDGRTNTSIIRTFDANGGVGTRHLAAKACHELDAHGHSDWFLPSKDELALLSRNKGSIGGFTSSWYWSSTEYLDHGAWTLEVGTGAVAPVTAVKSDSRAVRCMRR